MKNKILIGVAILLLLLVAVVRYEFSEKFEDFKRSISNYESMQSENFRNEKKIRLGKLFKEDKAIYQLFEGQFDENKSIAEKDTSFTYLYLSGNVKYRIPSWKYFDCLKNKCINDLQNEANQLHISNKEMELEKKYGAAYALWFSKLKDDKLLKKIDKTADDCNEFYPGQFAIYYSDSMWNDFEKLMLKYNADTKDCEIGKEQAENQFASNVTAIKHQLGNGNVTYFINQLTNRKSEIISTKIEHEYFSSPTLGSITYRVDKTTFDKQAFKRIADDAFEERWRNNSLSTGSMPYSNCYRSNYNCEYYDCSRITVKTGGSDVVVIIKDKSGVVVRHGYINAGHSFSFNVHDGSYQVFFYSGSGWNPNKLITSKSCGTLHGGFVTGEEVTKDRYVSLNNKQLTYELIMQLNGNLTTQPSSKNEAF